MRRFAGLAAGAVAAGLSWGAPVAQAITDCTSPLPAPVTVLSGQGSLESVVVDAGGRLFYTDTTAKALKRLDRPGGAPVTVASGIDAPGGLAFDGDGRHLFVGQGDSAAGGTLGNLLPSASLLRVDVDTGAVQTYATGLRMANGIVRAGDGTIFASSDVGTSLDRIAPGGGPAQNDWAHVVSGNGLAIDSQQTALFVNQTFVPAAIQRIDLDKPAKVTTFFRAGAADLAAGLDGMTIDRTDRLVVAANQAGQVWRIGTDGVGCALGRGLSQTSAVAYGRGPSGFSEGRLFAVGFDGVIAEIPAGKLEPAVAPPSLVDGPAPGSAITLRPRSAKVVRGRIHVVLHIRRGRSLVRATNIRAGRVKVRTGRPVTIRVLPQATDAVIGFTVGGKRYLRTIRLRR